MRLLNVLKHRLLSFVVFFYLDYWMMEFIKLSCVKKNKDTLIRGLTVLKLNEWLACCLRGGDDRELLQEVKDLIVRC